MRAKLIHGTAAVLLCDDSHKVIQVPVSTHSQSVMTPASLVKRKAAEVAQADSASKKVKVDVTRPERPPTGAREHLRDSEDPEHVETQEDLAGTVRGRRESRQRDKDVAFGAEGEGVKVTYRKLAPPRPFPTVPPSVSATGPRSAHVEGKNYICVTRKTPLGAYLRRCKGVVMKDGCALVSSMCHCAFNVHLFNRHKTLHLSAMGAAIPHLMQLSVSLPEILPHPRDEIHTEILTGTVDVQDEVIPEDEDEDISYRTRGKSTVSVIIKIGDGVDEGAHTGKGKKNPNKGVAQFRSGGNPSGRGQSYHHQQGKRAGKEKERARAADAAEPESVVVRVEDIEG